MLKIEKAIETIKDAEVHLKRLASLKNIDAPKTDAVAELHAKKTLKNAAAALKDAISANNKNSVKIKFKTFENIAKLARGFKHSTTGGVRTQRDIVTYSQIALHYKNNGRRFYEEFPTVTRDNLATTRVITPQLQAGTGQAGVVGEGTAKPVREWQLTVQPYPMQKIAVTDVVTEEFIRLLPDEELADFLITAHSEHVLDVFANTVQSFVDVFAGSNPVMPPALFTSALFPAAGRVARWHDFLAAEALYFKRLLEDNINDIEFPNLWIAALNVFWGIQQDRQPNDEYLHPNHDVERWYNNFSPRSIYINSVTLSSPRLIACNTSGFQLEIYDDVILTYERIAEQATENNLYRVTAEIFFNFYPIYQPVKAVYADVNDITNIN